MIECEGPAICDRREVTLSSRGALPNTVARPWARRDPV